MSSVRRRLTAVTLAAATTLALGACSPRGFDMQTNQQYQAGIGANHHGDIDVLNTLLVANPDGSATLSASIVNNSGTDQTVSSVAVTGTDDASLPVQTTESRLEVPTGRLVQAGSAEEDSGGYIVSSGAEPGRYVKVIVTFSDAPAVTIQAPVVARSSVYADVSTGITAAEDEADAAAEEEAAATEEEAAPTE